MSKHGADWYKRAPADYLGGVVGMPVRSHAVYGVVLDLIYVHGGACPNDPKWIAGWFCDLGSAGVRNTISDLIECGKLVEIDGALTNPRAQNEVKTREKLRENRGKTGKKGGVSSGKSRRAAKENKGLDEAKTHILEKRREEKKDIPKGISKETPPIETPASVLEPVLGKELAGDVVAHRQKLRKPMTARAATLLRNKLERCCDAKVAAETMIEKGWQSVEPEWLANLKRRQGGVSNDRFARKMEVARNLDSGARANGGMADREDRGVPEPLLSARRVGSG